MSNNGSKKHQVEIAPDVALFIATLDEGQRTFFIRTIATSEFNLGMLWEALGQWWNSLPEEERVAHIQDSIARFFQGREVSNSDGQDSRK